MSSIELQPDEARLVAHLLDLQADRQSTSAIGAAADGMPRSVSEYWSRRAEQTRELAGKFHAAGVEVPP